MAFRGSLYSCFRISFSRARSSFIFSAKPAGGGAALTLRPARRMKTRRRGTAVLRRRSFPAEQFDDGAQAGLSLRVGAQRGQAEVLPADAVDEGAVHRGPSEDTDVGQDHQGGLEDVGPDAHRGGRPAARVQVDVAVRLAPQAQDPPRIVFPKGD